MKTIKYVLSVALFVFANIVAYAQISHHPLDFPKYKDVQEFKKRQLIVIVNPPNPDLVEKYNRKGKSDIMDEYEQIIGNYNDVMKYATGKFWNFSSGEILYMTWDDMQKLMRDKNNRDKYYIMLCCSEQNHQGLDWVINGKGSEITGTSTYFAICFPDDNPLIHFHVVVPQLIPTAADLTFLISSMNYNFNYVYAHGEKADMKEMVDKNAHILANKTLLIRSDKVSPKALNDIGSFYPCHYAVVPDSVFTQAVLTGDSTCAYVIKAGMGDAMNFVVNCADGATLGYSKKGSDLTPYTSDQGLRKDFFEDIAGFCGAGMKK